LTAIDTDGTLIFSLTQVNTDQYVKMLFLTELANHLDIERPEWRTDTIILMDNASYNKGDDITLHIERLEIPTIFSGPYAFDSCPIELFFAYFKKDLLMQ
jgi:transposase